MEINIKRIAFLPDYTIGRLSIDGEYFCDTLEPTDRQLTQSMGRRVIQSKKVAGHTAIPTGTYRLLVTKSLRFRRWLPLVHGVPGFEGVRIHAGNRPEDTQGCILVGWNRRRGMLVNSRSALCLLMERIKGERVWVSIGGNRD